VVGAAHTLMMGVHSKPGGAVPFLGVAAGELGATCAPLDALWGRSAADLRCRLLEAGSREARFRVLESFLLAKARKLERHPAAALAVKRFDDLELRSVAEVNERTGLSPKRLIALFRDRVGLTPKAFWRVRRFQAAIRGLESAAGAAVSGAELAVRLGYFDQAHFIREFRELSGMSPGAYLVEERPRTNHVRLRG
jgi:AraC-like DNA-binding protein